ncbi:hypothetical protein JZO70_13815 [Enterococcus sp. 669A]|uniref:DUF4179 domain-containing protein n=1 Tax=Candidatus Enterococcus moelleringii TaxID=2815325 RepID=A0ABS3LFV0_9ENTE|nr:hypothetical protein [Enterococcus sp. 669A]MBO1307249.1 hypothetical protein [Enterococcus sp. 669A]
MSKKIEKHPFEHLTDQQLEEFLNYSEIPYTENNAQNIKEKFAAKKLAKPKKSRFNPRVIAIAIAAASILLLTAFTFRDELTLIYQKNFGSETEILLANSDRLDQEVEDQGIRLKAIGSFKDGNTTYFVAQLTDLTGDRLSEDTQISSWQMLNGGNSRVVDYDKTTKTATIITQAIDFGDNIKPGYLLESFTSSKKEFLESYPVNWQEVPQTEAWQKRPANEGLGGGNDPKAMKRLKLKFDELANTYLEPAANPIELGKYAAISALGFKEGLLHLQTKELNTVDSATFISLKNRETGEVVSEIASYGVDAGTHDNETDRPDYYEHIFEIPENALKNYDLFVEGFESQVYQKGQWAIQLQEPQELPAENLPDQMVKIDDQKVQLKNVRLSPISLSFDHVGYLNDCKIELVFKDGTTKELLVEAYEYQQENDYFEWQFGLDELDKFETVESVKINDQELKMK